MDARVRDILKRVERKEINTAEAYKMIQTLDTHKDQEMDNEKSTFIKQDSSNNTSQNDLDVWNNPSQSNSTTEILGKEIEKYLCNRISVLLGVEAREINKSENFMDLGIDSTSLIKMTSEIEKEWGLELYPTLFFEYQNITDLANYFSNDFTDKLLKIFNMNENRVIPQNFSVFEDRKNNTKSKISPMEKSVTLVSNIEKSSIISVKKDTKNKIDENDIAIIGMSGIFPNSSNLDEFWENIVKGENLIKEIPVDHFDYTPWFDTDPNKSDKIYTKWGGFLKEVDTFDAAFFNISPKEAIIMDPQIRLLLQVLYETIEDAGYPQKIRGSKTGMFVGACFHDYDEELSKHMSNIDPYLGTGNASSMISNRPSFFFDLKGPSLTVDTACSSSLVALHLATRALRNNECDMALVAGVNLLLSPKHYRYFCSIGALSPSGRCHTFDKEADGYIPAEGIASLLIKPLNKALEDGDRIHAIIKGSAVNHGGYTPSVTAPSVKQEAAVIKSAWEDAQIDPETLNYIEAHGTGTILGDPIEVNGIKSAFANYTKKEAFCLLGSTKAHIGHAEGAAGIAGVIKTVLSMKNNVIPPMPMYKELNPYIDLKASPILINKEVTEWKRTGNEPRRAGISSFGFGGTYAHVVIEDYENEKLNEAKESNEPQLIVLSAKNKDRLSAQILNMIQYLEDNSNDHTNINCLNQCISDEINKMVAEIIDINSKNIDRLEDFFEYGLDQINLSKLILKISQKYDVELNIDIIFENSSIEKLSNYLYSNYKEKISIFYPDAAVYQKTNRDQTITLANIAYTLQTGREMMEERLAVLASNVADLTEKLKELYYNNRLSVDMIIGNIKSNASHMDLLLQVLTGDESDKLINNLIQKNDLNKLAKLWIAGVDIDWNLLYTKKRPARISLPNYPFEKERFWPSFFHNGNSVPCEESIGKTSEQLGSIVGTEKSDEEIIQSVSRIWEECLGLKTVNQDDIFNEIGGNSIAASQILSQIKAIFKVEIPPSKFIDAQTVAKLSDLISLELMKNNSISSTSSNRNLDVDNSYVTTIPKRKSTNHVVLTSDQKRLWFLNKLDQTSCRHNIPALFKIKGDLNVDILSKGYSQILAEHESLRTSFGYENEQPIQIIHDEFEAKIEQIDLQALDENLKNKKIKEISLEMTNTPFDLEKYPLVRLTLINLGNQENILSIVVHHIISDIWSLGIFINQLFTTYDQLVCNNFIEKPVRYIHMADYAEWNENRMEEVSSKHLSYWVEKLSGAPDLLNLPTDRKRPTNQTYHAGKVKFTIPRDVYDKVSEQVKNTKSSLFITILSAFKIILQKASGQEDILIGSPIANRGLVETKDMIGFLANTLVLRTKISSDMSFMDVIERVDEVTYGAFDHQEISYSKVVEAIQPKRNTSYNPLFQVMFNFIAMPEYQNNSLNIEIIDQELPSTDFDMTLRVEERNSELHCFIDYNKDLFEITTINAYTEALTEVLREGSTHPDIRISDIKLPDRITKNKYQDQIITDHKQSIVVSSTFTAEPLKESLEFWMNQLGLESQIKFAQYNQVYQQLLDPNQLLLKNSYGIDIIMFRFEDWIRYDETSNISEKIAIIKRNHNDFINMVCSSSLQMAVPLIIVLCPSDAKNSPELLQCYETCTEELIDGLRNLDRVYTITPNDIDRTYSVSNIFDEQANKIGHVPFTMQYFTILGTMISRKIRALKHAPYKVIVLDCDQTLWKGICGEVGASGIEINEQYKIFHQLLIDQYNSGTLLCLCSKNNENEVLEVFNKRIDMPLKLEHVVATRINWQPKSENIKELSSELNLGLDSFIFIDDNPMEIEEVRANAPEVYTIQFPAEDPGRINDLIKHTWVFDKTNISEEDKKRTEMYKQEAERKKAELQIPSFDDFIKSLNLKIDISPIADDEFQRVEQLMIRTNQFNTTTIRYSEEDIRNLLKNETNHCLTVKVSDRFGDYGLVGVILYSELDNTISIDSMILSCRVLGKGIEHNILSKLGEIAINRKKDFVSIKYSKTVKNAPVKDFLDSLQDGSDTISDDAKSYDFTSEKCSNIRFNPKNSESNKKSSQKKLSIPIIRPGKKILESIPTAFSNIENVITAINSEMKKKSQNLDTGEEMPQDEMEEKIASIYKDILNLDYVGVERNFFELGGTSLLLVQLSSKLKEISNKDVSITDLFKYPTVRSLSGFLNNKEKVNVNNKGRSRGERQRSLLMQFRGIRE